jgi:hypothetical protein
MPNLTDTDLRDPSPPVPGDKERAAVAARAQQLGRRRRMLQGAGALGMVAAVAVGVAALTAGGASGPGARHIEAASSAGASGGTSATVAPTASTTPVTTVPAPTADTTPAPTESDSGSQFQGASVPEPAPDTTPAPAAAPSTFTVSGTVSNIPADVTLTLTLSGSGRTFSAIADGAGNFSISGIPAGTYDASYEWVSTDGTATQVGKMGGVTINGDSNVSFTLP